MRKHLRRCKARVPTAVAQSTVEDDVTTASSAIAIAGNDDILSEIIVRAPLKSQVRFKSVSKSWLSLISSPGFSLLRSSFPRLSGLLLRKKWPYLVHPAPAAGPSFEFFLPKSSLSGDPPLKSLNFVPSNGNFSGVDILQSCNECIEEMPVPAIPGFRRHLRNGKHMLFGESDGHLHLIAELFTTKFQVFEMENDYSGWFVKYHVDLDGFVAAFPAVVRSYLDPLTTVRREYYAFSILGVIRREENEDESLLLLNVPDKIVRCYFEIFPSLKDGTLKELLYLLPDDERYVIRLSGSSNVCGPRYTNYNVFHYIESLALV
ncbi:hypothetical protein RHGRI_009794 [Rhododendron griersonianum]|uniref:F-box domain-containing protein n=1 Tax=Rhododendron griersonianum TaxID=479676 RepID=A0AAV6KGB8_9ERIC|nr:hypothetical protein RHGRI_009794 [Rhododendron griersonianum]